MLVKQHSEPPHCQFAQRLLLLLSNVGYPTDPDLVHQALLRSSPSLRVTLISVKHWLNGRAMPRPRSIQALSQWLKVPQSMLVFGEQEPNLLEAQLAKKDLTFEASRLLEEFMALTPHNRRSVAEVVKALKCLQEREPLKSPAL